VSWLECWQLVGGEGLGAADGQLVGEPVEVDVEVGAAVGVGAFRRIVDGDVEVVGGAAAGQPDVVGFPVRALLP
jgi:hypothetical protein